MAGRPSNAEVRERTIAKILEEHAAGMSITEACTKYPGFTPAQFRSTVRGRKDWKEARADHAHALFDQLIALTAQLRDTKWGKDDNAQVTAIRTAIDALKHATSRLLPSDYGEQKAGVPAMSVTFVTSLPLGPDAKPESAVDTAFRVVTPLPEIEDHRGG